MGFYEGFLFLKKEGALDNIEYDMIGQSAFVYVGKNSELRMRVKDSDCVDEKILSVIHECWHYGSHFRKYLGSGLQFIEDDIEERARVTFKENPLLVRCLRKAVFSKVSLSDVMFEVCEKMKRERIMRVSDKTYQMNFDFMFE